MTSIVNTAAQETPVDYSQPVTGQALRLWSDTPPDYRPKEGSTRVPEIIPYLLPEKESKGFVIVLPGGGYGGLAEHEGKPVAQAFNKLGFSAAVVFYRVSGWWQTPLKDGPVRDASRAVRIVRAHAAAWGTSPDKIAILGFSAGGNLAGCSGVLYSLADQDIKNDGFAAVSSRPDAVIPCYGVLLSGQHTHSGSINNLAGDDQELRAKFDVPSHITATTPPFFLWHTSEDGGVSPLNSINTALALAKNKVPYALHIFTKGGHGIGLGANNPEAKGWEEMAAIWLENVAFKK